MKIIVVNRDEMTKPSKKLNEEKRDFIVIFLSDRDGWQNDDSQKKNVRCNELSIFPGLVLVCLLNEDGTLIMK